MIFCFFNILICASEPSISSLYKRLSKDITKYEPRSALDGGNDGLDVIRKVIYKSRKILKSNGILALEVGTGQHGNVIKILSENKFRLIEAVRDYKNNIRCIYSTLL